MAEALKGLGFEVTTGIGGNGVVGVFKNGIRTCCNAQD